MVQAVKPNRLTYTGQKQPTLGERDENGQLLYPYLPSPGLVEAVNLAIFLQRPLLIKGEPGCGKTKLARAVAYELSLPYEAWIVKSTSRAQDGLYTYDNVRRLRDAQLAAIAGPVSASISNDDQYIKYGPLGRAFDKEQRTVVLIDEIDKADIDFPNDLLLELDEQRFVIQETQPEQTITAKHPPIVLITSNDEKELPDAFLRRCLFHYIEFPNTERLIEIINARFPAASEDLVETAVDRFEELREDMEGKGQSGKKVSTSELIDWFHVLHTYAPQDEILAKLDHKLPYPGVLLKSWDDHRRYLGKQ
ncbi:MAG: AAA family ATPase [Ardenticatenaceae bacterium]